MTGFFLCGVELEDCGAVGEASAPSPSLFPSPVGSSLKGGAVAERREERTKSQRMTVHRCQRITYCLTIDGTGVLCVVHVHSSFVGSRRVWGEWPSDGMISVGCW